MCSSWRPAITPLNAFARTNERFGCGGPKAVTFRRCRHSEQGTKSGNCPLRWQLKLKRPTAASYVRFYRYFGDTWLINHSSDLSVLRDAAAECELVMVNWWMVA